MIFRFVLGFGLFQWMQIVSKNNYLLGPTEFGTSAQLSGMGSEMLVEEHSPY